MHFTKYFIIKKINFIFMCQSKTTHFPISVFQYYNIAFSTRKTFVEYFGLYLIFCIASHRTKWPETSGMIMCYRIIRLHSWCTSIFLIQPHVFTLSPNVVKNFSKFFYFSKAPSLEIGNHCENQTQRSRW